MPINLGLLLSERVFNCEHFNFSCDRDLNAGLNLAGRAKLSQETYP